MEDNADIGPDRSSPHVQSGNVNRQLPIILPIAVLTAFLFDLFHELLGTSYTLHELHLAITVIGIAASAAAIFVGFSRFRKMRQDYAARLSTALRFDSHKRERIESALRESQTRFGQIADLLPVALFETDLNGTLTLVNHYGREMYGVTQDQLDAGLNLLSLADESERDRARQNIRHILFGTGREGSSEYYSIRGDGSRFWALVRTVPIVRDERVVGMRGFAMDITERRASEHAQAEHAAFLQEVLNSLPNAVFYKDADLRYQICNDIFLESFGGTRDTLIGRRYSEAHDDTAVTAMVENLDRFLLDHPGRDTREIELTTRDGTIRQYVSNRITHVDSEGKPRGILGVYSDITDLKRAQQIKSAAEERQRRIIECSPMGIHIYELTDDDTLILCGANPAADEIMGREYRQLIGHPVEEVFPGLSGSELLERMRDIADSGQPLYWEQLLYNDQRISGAFEIHAFQTAAREITVMFHDISDRKTAENKLRESEERYRILIENQGEGLGIVDEAENFIFANPAACETFGVGDGELEGKNLSDFVDAENLEIIHAQTRLRQNGEQSRYEFDIIRPSGERRCLSITVRPYFDANKNYIGGIGVFRDMTDLRRIQEELRRTNENLNRVIAASPLPIISVDAEGAVTEIWNQAAQRMWGWGHDKVKGRRLPIFPEDAIPVLRKILDQITQGRMIDGAEVELCAWDGTTIPVALYAVPLMDTAGRITECLTMFVDRSESKRIEAALRESEERFRSLADSAPVLMWMGGVGRHCFYFNRMWLSFTGRSLHTEYGRGWLGGVHPADRERVITIYENAFQQRQMFVCEYRLLHADGTYHWLLDRGTPRLSPDGNFSGFIGACTDISDIKLAQEAMSESEERFRAIFNAAQDPIFIKNTDRRYTQINPATELSLDVPASKIIGRTDDEISAPDVAAITLGHDLSVLNGEVTEYELTELINGRQDTHHVIKVPLRDHDGKVIGICGIARDISARRRTEQLLEAERRLFISGPTVVFRWRDEPGWPVDYVSPNVMSQWGYDPDDFLKGGLVYAMIMHPDDVPRIEQEVRRHLEDGDNHYECEYRIRTKNDHIRWIRESTVLNRDAFGKVVDFHGYCEDITDHKNARATLDAERRLFVAGPMVVFCWRVAGSNVHLDYVSPNVQIELGYTPEHMTSSSFVLQEFIHPDDIGPLMKQKFAYLQTGVPFFSCEFRVRHANGDFLFVREHNVAEYGDNGEVVSITSYAYDVTDILDAMKALRQSEHRFRLMTEKASDIMWTASPDLRPTYVNSAIERVLGWPAEAILKKKASEFLTRESFRHFHDLVQRARGEIESGTADEYSTWTLAAELICKDRTTRWAQVTIGVTCDENRKIQQWIGIAKELTAMDVAIADEAAKASGGPVSGRSVDLLARSMESQLGLIEKTVHQEQPKDSNDPPASGQS